mgnify:FL=1
MSDEQRVQAYAERFWFRYHMTAWPTVRKVARGLNIGMRRVVEAVESGHRCFLQGYNVEEWADADLEVVTHTEATEKAWNDYWSGFNRSAG